LQNAIDNKFDFEIHSIESLDCAVDLN